MASFRRTLSPYNHQNGGSTSPFSPNSPSHKHNNNSYTNTSTRFSTFGVGIRRFIGGGEKHVIPHHRKGYRTWRRSIYSCFFFFLLGFLLALAPFGPQFEDRDISFDLDLRKQHHDHQDIVIDKVELSVPIVKKERFDYATVRKHQQVIVVTPTYNRALQSFYLHRLGQLLRLVPPPLLWIVVEMTQASTETADILRGMGIMYRHLVCTKNLTDVKDRGVHQRNTALEHIEHHKLDGIVYFADDDNVYSLQLFETLREIKYLLCFILLSYIVMLSMIII